MSKWITAYDEIVGSKIPGWYLCLVIIRGVDTNPEEDPKVRARKLLIDVFPEAIKKFKEEHPEYKDVADRIVLYRVIAQYMIKDSDRIWRLHYYFLVPPAEEAKTEFPWVAAVVTAIAIAIAGVLVTYFLRDATVETAKVLQKIPGEMLGISLSAISIGILLIGAALLIKSLRR